MIGLNYLGRMGQLGNQMFQYAALRGVAAKHGYDYTIPDHKEQIKDSLGNILRIELFDVFDIHPQQTGYLLADGVRSELHFHFDEELMNNCPDNISLVGYFQSEKYFKHIEDTIRNEFTFKREYLEACEPHRPLVQGCIALHIRRGDFLINSLNHHNLSLKYYENALKEFPDDQNVVIFSDDPKWCKEQPLFSGDRFLVSESDNSYVDLCLMSMCSHFIIANSTFSWWGAWLSRVKDKVVVYPSKWFGPNNADKLTKDLFPEEWRMIDEN
jgi:hypothetical protein